MFKNTVLTILILNLAMLAMGSSPQTTPELDREKNMDGWTITFLMNHFFD